MHAGEVGVPRLLQLFKKHGLTTTWFVPGHSLETFPKEMAAVRDAGHEIGLHGYSHENVGSRSLLGSVHFADLASLRRGSTAQRNDHRAAEGCPSQDTQALDRLLRQTTSRQCGTLVGDLGRGHQSLTRLGYRI